MKVICISCSDHYETRMRGVTDYFINRGDETQYLITDFNHFTKSRYVENHGNAKQLHVPVYKKNISPQRLLSHYIFAQKVLKELKKEEPDFIYCMVPPNSLVKYVSKYKYKNNNCKLIFDIYDMWPESFPYKKNNPIMKMGFKIWADLRDRYIKNADVILTVSEKTKQAIDEKFGVTSKVLRPFVAPGNLPNYSANIGNEISFCYIGHVNHITDIELGTELLSRISEQRKVVLHIIGEGQNKKKWIDLLTEAGVKVIEHGVIFDEQKKKEVFSQCSLGLNIPRKEIASSLSLKSIEYMRYGIPFINSGIGDNEDMIRNEKIGINILNGNVQECVKTLFRLKENDFIEMHNNCVQYYNKVFANPNYDELLGLL